MLWTEQQNTSSSSSYIETEKEIKKLETRVEKATSILNWRGGVFKKEWRDEV